MKKRILSILIVILAILIIPVSFLIAGFCTESRYSETYYGELSDMVGRLKNSTKKKIIIIGNSSVAFGIDSALTEQELALDGLDYEVCNFGLYGSIGTKAMLDLAEAYIEEGDIIIFSPELNRQSMSLYFSAKEMWYAADSDFSLLSGLKNKDAMVGAFPAYVAGKIRTEPVKVDGVYAKASFDERCDMKNASRDYNIMADGYDANNPLSFDLVWDEDFTEYVNDYYEMVTEKGAEMLYYFAPMNREAMPEDYESGLDGYYDYLSEKLDFLILGNPQDAVMDYEWFYDSNVHLNSAGMQKRTITFINDLKLYFEKTTPVQATEPAKPAVPKQEASTEDAEDAGDEGWFIYETTENGRLITGLTEEGKQQKSLVLPSSVYAFTAGTFQNDTVVEEITLPDSITVLYDQSFSGCTALKKLVLLQENPEKLSVGYSLLEGAGSCSIYVTKEAFSAYSSNYFWGHYADKLEID